MKRKIDLTDTAFLIPVRIDSVARLENLQASIRSIIRYTNAYVKVLEASRYNNHILENMLDPAVDYFYVEDHDIIFHRTHYINVLVRQCSCRHIVIWDADVIVPPRQLQQAVSMLRNDVCDVVFPYDGRFYDTTRIIRELYLESEKLSLLQNNVGKMPLPYGSDMGGGAIFIKREKFDYADGEDERFYGWGPEDWNRLEKWKRIGLKIGRAAGPLFHLSHPKDLNGGHSLDLQKTNTFYLLRKTQMSSAKEILQQKK